MKKDLTVVLVSGGMDSCVTAAIANEKYCSAFLHVNYGQRTEERELRAFNEIADFYKAGKKLIVSLEHLKVIGGSALTDTNIPVPELDTPHSALRTSGIPSTTSPSATLTCSPSQRPGPRSSAPRRYSSARSRKTARAIPTAVIPFIGHSTKPSR